MERIDRLMVIGCSGSGKSTFSMALSEKTGVPVIHLDRLFWREGWTQVSTEEFDSLLTEEMRRTRWIMDGNYSRTMAMRLQKTDAVALFELPRHVCIISALKRILHYHGRVRPDMGDGCPERLDPSFIAWIWNFRKNNAKKMDELLAEAPDVQVYRIKSRRQLPELMNELTERMGNTKE